MPHTFTLALDLHIARRVRIHQLVDESDKLLASERTLSKLLERLAVLTADGHAIVTDDGLYTIKVLRTNDPPHNEKALQHGQS